MTRSMTTRGPRTAAALIACIAATLLLAPAARADILAPTVPGGLKTAAVSSTSVDLSWNAATDDVGVTGYTVYRDGIAIGTPPSTSFSDATVVAGTTYEYSVDAVDAAQNHSARSAPLTVTAVAPVTVESLCQDTVAALKSSPKYPANKPAVDAAASRLCSVLASIAPQLSDTQKRNLVAAYKALLPPLVRSGWLTGLQATDLSAKADRLLTG
jgi:hypothetical protein